MDVPTRVLTSGVTERVSERTEETVAPNPPARKLNRAMLNMIDTAIMK
jgi:hypothetical protein